MRTGAVFGHNVGDKLSKKIYKLCHSVSDYKVIMVLDVVLSSTLKVNLKI